VESEITVEEACDVNHLIRPHPVFSALCMLPAELIPEETPPAAALQRRFMPRYQVRRSRPRDGAILWLVRRTCFKPPLLPGYPVLHSRRHARRSIVCRRECVLDFCRDPTHVYPRAPARTTARRSDPRSRKGRPRPRAAREQYVHHSLSLSLVAGNPCIH
jgi:hypothetical protein